MLVAAMCIGLLALPVWAQRDGGTGDPAGPVSGDADSGGVVVQGQGTPGEVDYDLEVFGMMGWGRLGADEGSRGSGPWFGGGLAVRPFRRVGFEVEAGVLLFERNFPSSVRFGGNAVLVSGNVLYHFSESRRQVYVVGGLGVLHTDQTVEYLDLVMNTTLESSGRVDTFAVWSGGVGLKAFVTTKLLVRPEVSYYGGGALGVLGLPRLTVALGYYW